MYEAVYAHPDGESTVARQALTAAEYGYDGIVVRNHGDDPAAYDAEAISEEYGIDVASGVEVRTTDRSKLGGYVGNHRSKRTIVAVHGGEPAINRAAVETPAVDVLAHPMAGDGDFNHVLATAAAENGVRVEFALGGVLRESGGSRVRALQDLRKLRELVVDADAPFVVSAGPRSHLQFRAPRELRALGAAIGFDADQITAGLREWECLVERNRQLSDSSFVGPGIRLENDSFSSDST